MIDLTKIPPFANAAWANEPDAPCLWCAGTGHVNGDYADGEICDCPDTSVPSGCCECGDPQCDGDAKWLASAAEQIAEQLADSLPELDSPILRLVKERNEARELVKRLLYTAQLGDDSKDKFDAVLDGHKAVFKWKGGAK